ncbi:DUF3549 family protein [Salinicola sp. DM10]|uniref:DUF3549 family protein n=1 Tax=Salinicola sp. DM10 TaxID=2815721 RepID=UPI001A8F723C|nr:DUF3549 family protein [Salinicola sp. DM10]MCE3026275.1 DUF3549 family protein [Salinicola sp. DM10]
MQTLSDFFAQSGAEVALANLGRRVAPLTRDTFEAFERERQAWPLPWNAQAQFACALRWPAAGNDPVVWFLALPLDEQGMLSPASRDAFLERLLLTLGASGEAVDTSAPDNLMQDNPVALEPELHQRALLHARLSRHFAQPPSPQRELAARYLAGDAEVHWQLLGLQGLADWVVDPDPATCAALAPRLGQLPREVLIPLCYLMEHGDLPTSLHAPLTGCLEQAQADQDLERYCALLRALLGSHDATVSAWLGQWLERDELMAADCLVAVAARGWHHLEDEGRLGRFLERLAANEQLHFRRVVRDLALIPRLRLPILMMLRQAPRDSALGRRVAEWNV